MKATKNEQIEIDYWRDSPKERPGANSVEVLAHKFSESRVLLSNIEQYQPQFARARTVLELAGGQGWAACIVKRLFPETKVITSDISEYAVASLPMWEQVLNVRLDDSFACRSADIPLASSSIDLIFCFSAAHHFESQRETLTEIRRVLVPGGVCLYLREPSCRRYIYPLAYKRVNRIRPAVPENVLVFPELVQLGHELGFTSEYQFDPSTIHRGAAETLYYMVLQKMPLLRQILPCTVNYIFTKTHDK